MSTENDNIGQGHSVTVIKSSSPRRSVSATPLSAELRRELDAIRGDVKKHSAILRDLRTREAALEEKLGIASQHETRIQDLVFRKQVESLKSKLDEQDVNIRKLQSAYEQAVSDRLALEDEFNKVLSLGEAPAGKKQVTTNVPSSRYELMATMDLRSGRSHDPLAQGPVPTVNQFTAAKNNTYVEPQSTRVTSVDEIGQSRPSPYINEDDYKVGSRDSNAEDLGSFKFKTWRRPASRVSQPPGGKSSMDGILG